MCKVGCLPAPLTVPTRSQNQSPSPLPGCGNPGCLQTLPDIPWGAKSPRPPTHPMRTIPTGGPSATCRNNDTHLRVDSSEDDIQQGTRLQSWSIRMGRVQGWAGLTLIPVPSSTSWVNWLSFALFENGACAHRVGSRTAMGLTREEWMQTRGGA